MYGDRRFTRYVCYFVVVTMFLMSVPVQTVRAAIIKT
jgi:hypothetical protein